MSVRCRKIHVMTSGYVNAKSGKNHDVTATLSATPSDSWSISFPYMDGHLEVPHLGKACKISSRR